MTTRGRRSHAGRDRPAAGFPGRRALRPEDAATYRAGGDGLLPLGHAQALLQARALLHRHVPAAVWVLGPDAGTGKKHRSVSREAVGPARRAPGGRKVGARRGEPRPREPAWEPAADTTSRPARGRARLFAHTSKDPIKMK